MRRTPHREAGTIMVFALMVLVVGAVILAGWIHVMAVRVVYTEHAQDAVKRRIVLENSRALASQYMLGYVLSGSLGTTVSGTISMVVPGWSSTDTNWGGFTLTATNAVPLTAVNLPAAINPLSPGGSGGYIAVISGTLSDGTPPDGTGLVISDYGWNFYARSRSPMLGFDLFTSQVNPSGNDIHISSGLGTAANVVLWAPDAPNTYSLTGATYQTPSISTTTITSNGVDPLLPSNFAFPPVTTGVSLTGSSSSVYPGGSGAPYNASLLYKAGGPAGRTPIDTDAVSVFSGTVSGTTAMVNTATTGSVNGVTSAGDGTITIDLTNQALQKVYIVSPLTRITFQGYPAGTTIGLKSAEDLPPVLVTYVETGSSILNTIALQNSNNRKLYLGVKKATNGTVSIQPAASGTWRLGATFENTPVTFATGGGTLLITGGMRTDQSVTVSSGTVSISRETNPLSLLEQYADRNVWLETYAQ